METMPERASNLNMAKDVNANVKPLDKKGKAKKNDLREVIRKYLENATNSESVVNKTQEGKEEAASRNERKEVMDSKQEKKEDVTDSLTSLKSTSVNVRKDQNCQNGSRDAEKKNVNIFNKFGENILPGHASNKDRNREIPSHVEVPFNQLRNTEKLCIPGISLKIANLDVSTEGTTEMIGKDIAAKLDEPRVDMVVALVAVIGTEAALRIFKETQNVEAGGGLMIKNGARRRTAGGTFFQLIREMKSPNIDMQMVNSVFEKLNEVAKMDSDRIEKKEMIKLDRPCDYFNDTGMCKFKSGHFSQSGFTRRIHSCRFCFYRHEVENEHPEIQCPLYRIYLSSIGNTFQSKEEHSIKLQNGDVTRQSKETAIEKTLTGSNGKNNTFQLKEEHSNKLQNGDVARHSKETAIQKTLTGSNMKNNTFQSKEERSNKYQNGDVTRQSKATAMEKTLTGSNAMPIGIRRRPIEKRERGTVEQENMRGNSALSSIMSVTPSAIMSTKVETGKASQTGRFSPFTGQAPSAVEHSSSPNISGKEVERETREIFKSKNEMKGNSCERSKKMVQFQNSFGGEKDMKKAKEKLTMLSDQISKSVRIDHQDYQAKEELELIAGHSSIKNSMLPQKTDELDSKKNTDCKLEPQNSKDKNRKGKSSVKGLDKIQGQAKQGELIEKNVEKKKGLQDVNRGKGKSIEAEKQKANESAQDKYEKKKEIVQNKTIGDTAEDKEKKASKENKDKELKDDENAKANKPGIFAMKPPRKEKYDHNINVNESESKKGLLTKKDVKEQTQTAAVNKCEKKQDNKFEENKIEESKVDKPMQKPESKLSNSSSVDLFRQSKSVAQGRLANASKVNGNRKEKLHCPCPPYCPKCLNIVKMEKLG